MWFKGDSMRPRFLPGEVILFAEPALTPGELVDQFAVVQRQGDGAAFIKILRRGAAPGKWRLESLNGESEEGVELLAAWRYLGVLPAAKPEPLAEMKRPSKSRPVNRR